MRRIQVDDSRRTLAPASFVDQITITARIAPGYGRGGDVWRNRPRPERDNSFIAYSAGTLWTFANGVGPTQLLGISPSMRRPVDVNKLHASNRPV
jgi:hypothetical protein